MRALVQQFPRWSIVLFATFVLLSAAVVLAAPAALPSLWPGGVGVDPLSPDEMALAEQRVWETRGAEASAVRVARPAAPGAPVISAPAEEVVLVERHAEEKSVMAAGAWKRRADVFIYRYADDTLLHSVYDFASGESTPLQEAKGVQYPLNESERALAVQLLFADPAGRRTMQDEYRRITGRELTTVEQIESRVFVYHAGANPELESPEVATCGLQRCAQLMILADDNITFDVLPIVNLSTLRVVSLTPIAVDPAAAPAGAEGAGAAEHEHGGTQ